MPFVLALSAICILFLFLFRFLFAEPPRRNSTKASAPSFKEHPSSVTLHTNLLGVGGTIYNNHTLGPLKDSELGHDSQRAKRLASKLHVQSVFYAARLVHTIRALSSTIITLIKSQFQVKLATLLIPKDLYHFLCSGGVF